MAHSWENGDDPVATMGASDTLEHKAVHLGYEEVSTPFEVGSETGNRPE